MAALSTAPPKPVQRRCGMKTLVQGLGVTRPRMHQQGMAALRKYESTLKKEKKMVKTSKNTTVQQVLQQVILNIFRTQ